MKTNLAEVSLKMVIVLSKMWIAQPLFEFPTISKRKYGTHTDTMVVNDGECGYYFIIRFFFEIFYFAAGSRSLPH